MKKIKKNKVLFATTMLSLAVSASLQASTFKQVADKPESPLPKRYIVKYKNDNAVMAMALQSNSNMPQVTANRMATLGVQNAQFKASLNAVVAQLSDTQLLALRNDSQIEYVEEDLPRRLMSQTQPYGIAMVQADLVDDSVASAANGGKKICVIDSGLDLPHEDMGTRGATVSGTNDSGTGNWYDHGGPHGTHVAGTIAALNNGIGVRGVIGTDPSMHIIKVFNDDGWGYSSELVDAINKCQAAGSDVVNMSLGGEGSSITERNGIQAAADAGMLLIAAAGNDGVPTNTTDIESYPASYDSVMSVAAIDSNKDLADFSQKNSQVEISGPGVDVNSAYPEGLGSIVSLSVAGQSYDSNGMENQGNANAALYNFATGEAVDTGANGKVCLIERGNISFHDKVKNCEDSGGVGAILYNNAAGSFGGTLGDTNQTTIPAVTVSDTDGAQMLNNIGMTASVNLDASNYGLMSGTSMASPHVAGVAALVWSHHPSCTAEQIRAVLTATAQDLGAAGRDVKFGHGLVQTKDAIDSITQNGCDGTGGPVQPPVGNELANGVAKSGLSGSAGEEILFTFEVPAGATDVKVNMSGGTGDADLYAQFGSKPSDSNFECRPYAGGNNEGCTLNQSGGTYHVMVKGYSAFSGVSLVASFTEGGTTNPDIQPIAIVENGISVARRNWTRFTLELADGYADLNVTTSGGSGDADLYVTRGTQSTTSNNDCGSESGSNNESCSLQNPQAGTWYIDIYGYRASSGITLNVTATPK